MNDLLDPEKNAGTGQHKDSQFSQRTVYVREDDQDWGSSGMKNIQETSHPFRAWGYPVAPAVFVAVSAVMVVNYVWRQPLESGVGIVCIVAGIPLYWMFKKTSRDKVIEQ